MQPCLISSTPQIVLSHIYSFHFHLSLCIESYIGTKNHECTLAEINGSKLKTGPICVKQLIGPTKLEPFFYCFSGTMTFCTTIYKIAFELLKCGPFKAFCLFNSIIVGSRLSNQDFFNRRRGIRGEQLVFAKLFYWPEFCIL